jgi:hypothetical protein
VHVVYLWCLALIRVIVELVGLLAYPFLVAIMRGFNLHFDGVRCSLGLVPRLQRYPASLEAHFNIALTSLTRFVSRHLHSFLFASYTPFDSSPAFKPIAGVTRYMAIEAGSFFDATVRGFFGYHPPPVWSGASVSPQQVRFFPLMCCVRAASLHVCVMNLVS